MSMENPLTPAGIEPAPFQTVAQHLNHCATAVPLNEGTVIIIKISKLIIIIYVAIPADRNVTQKEA